MLIENKLNQIIKQQHPEASSFIDLMYDKKNILVNSLNYIARDLDRTMIVKTIDSIELEYNEFLEIKIKINNNIDYKFIAKSSLLEINKQNLIKRKI